MTALMGNGGGPVALKEISAVPVKTKEGEISTVLYALDYGGRLWALYPYHTGWTAVESPKYGQ